MTSPNAGAVVIWPLSETEVVAFGPPEELDLLGSSRAEVPRPFVDALRLAVAASPQLQHALDTLTGRVLRLTAESAELLSQHHSVTKGGLMTGIVRDDAGHFAGLLTFTDPGLGLAALAGSLPAIGGAIALQMQLARLERALDEIKQEITYLVRQKHLELEAGIETVLEILADVYRTLERQGVVEDDQWDRIAISEPRLRDLHRVTRKNLRSLSEALDDASAPLPVRLARLNRALNDERTELWLRAHVHAELALARWECLYLVRSAQLHPEELGILTGTTRAAIDERHAELVELAGRIDRYVQDGGQVTGLVDRLRLVSRVRLRRVLRELRRLLAIYERDLDRVAVWAHTPATASNGTLEPSHRKKTLATRVRALPTGLRPALDLVAKIPSRVKRQERPPARSRRDS